MVPPKLADKVIPVLMSGDVCGWWIWIVLVSGSGTRDLGEVDCFSSVVGDVDWFWLWNSSYCVSGDLLGGSLLHGGGGGGGGVVMEVYLLPMLNSYRWSS